MPCGPHPLYPPIHHAPGADLIFLSSEGIKLSALKQYSMGVPLASFNVTMLDDTDADAGLQTILLLHETRVYATGKFSPNENSLNKPFGSRGVSGETLVEKQVKVKTSLKAIFATVKLYRHLLSCDERDAQSVLDAFQTLLDTGSFEDRKQMIGAMRRLSARTNLYPTRLILKEPPEIRGVSDGGGGFANIYRVLFRGEETCFKVIRYYEQVNVERMAKAINTRIRKEYAKEAILWGQLSHPNILPFYGLARIGSRLAFVSRWAANGNLVEYLRNNPDANRLLLCADTAAGMEYLHGNDIVHGDLKGFNVLIDSSGRAALGDFGLSSVTDPQILEWSTQSAMASKGGTRRWQAPELLKQQETEQGDPLGVHNTKESDVFAWAGVCYEIFTGRVPYYEKRSQMAVLRIIVQGEKPTRPDDNDEAWIKHGLTRQMWGLMEDCWAFQANNRPNAKAVVARVEKDGQDTRGRGEWMDAFEMRFQKWAVAVEDVKDAEFWEGLDLLLARAVPLETRNPE